MIQDPRDNKNQVWANHPALQICIHIIKTTLVYGLIGVYLII